MKNNGRLARLEREAGPAVSDIDFAKITDAELARIDFAKLADAELDALLAFLPPSTPEEQAWVRGLTDVELDALIAGGRLQAIAGLVEQESKKSRERYRASAFVRNFPADLSHSGV